MTDNARLAALEAVKGAIAVRMGCQDCGTGAGECPCLDAARAAVRAAQEVGAILVAEMPGDEDASCSLAKYPTADMRRSWHDGHNAALAAVRAKAVTP